MREEALGWLNRLRSSGSEEHHAEFERWYSAEPLHADIYDDVLATWEKTALAEQTPAAAMRHRQRPRSRYGYALAAAAAIILVVVASLTFYRQFGPDERSGSYTVVARAGEIRTVALADGSQVTLDSGSSLRIAFTDDARRMSLERGRARFAVAHEADRPFIVDARGRSVVAHGTLFDVSLIGDRVTVSLLEGEVEIRDTPTAKQSSSARGTLLAAGQRVTLAPHEPAPQPSPFQPAQERWPSGMLSFEDTPLREVVETANRYSSIRILLAQPGLGQLRFTGTVRAGDSDELAQMIAAMFGLSHSRDPAGNIILAKRREPST
ncbi:FecR family protein [Sphingosinithalassobacter sp. CS137]|uniref:FecR family protein n=1 Tax=Sphingosinithalassobacter sp. CS137 TaxID=2762748 RepID=UPI00165DB13E|nr:FecR domain-containing protein [Sphingosinithalassobacter sp. CS137]